MADEDIVVEIEKEAATPPAGEQQGTQADPIADLKAQYEELEASKKAEQEGRQAAERRAQTESQRRAAAEREAETARTEVAESRLSTIEQGIAAATTESNAAKAEYKAAMEAGDWGKAGDAQERLAASQARLVRLDEAKSDLEVARPQQRQTERPQQTEVHSDPVEAYIQGRTEPTAKWLREHKDFITDQRKNAKLTSAHWDAMGEGHAVDSPEYFEHVEKFLGLRKDAKQENGSGNGAQKPNGNGQQRRAASAPVAPVSGGSSGTNGGGNVVHLTKGEAAAATDGTHVWNYDDSSPQKRFKKGDPIGVQEMARRKKAMSEQGLYDKTYVEN